MGPDGTRHAPPVNDMCLFSTRDATQYPIHRCLTPCMSMCRLASPVCVPRLHACILNRRTHSHATTHRHHLGMRLPPCPRLRALM